jgi:transposase
MDPSRESQVKHLFEVEHLSRRQIADLLHMCHKTVARILGGRETRRRSYPPSELEPFARLIEQWYRRYPSLQAAQIQKRLSSYGYRGSYRALCRFTETYRKKRRKAYHELEFLPAEVIQVDWMVANLPFGRVYGFVFILAWSRYLFVRFYPRSSMEFFLDGHISAYNEIGGTARSNWYDNLSSVVIKRKPELTFNAQFVDYMSHMGVSIHACNPGKGNEKGRVERAIKDLRAFVETNEFADIRDLNRKTDRWRKEKNERVHRATRRTPAKALPEEPLLPLPAIPYKPYRVVQATIGKTAFVEFDTNRYSVPTDYAEMTAAIFAYPGHVEIMVNNRNVASHARSFARHQKIENPSHRAKLLDRTPHGKHERIYHLMRRMGNEVDRFLAGAESEGEDPLQAAYGLFRLLRSSSKEMLLSAVREACALNIHRLRYIESLLGPKGAEEAAVYPQNTSLLDISYEKRELADYDGLV